MLSITTNSGASKTATSAGTEQTFTYDRHGNIIAIATSGENDRSIGINANDATYDLANRRLYLYNASNERIATIELLAGDQQQSDWTICDDAGKILRRYKKHPNGAWSWEEDYIYRGSHLLAAEIPGLEKVRHFHLDHLGTPRLITGNGGASSPERTYGAFGRGLNVESTPPPQELAQFTGHERDDFQLDYMHARYYDPMLGDF